jgi:hypothetical protein
MLLTLLTIIIHPSSSGKQNGLPCPTLRHEHCRSIVPRTWMLKGQRPVVVGQDVAVLPEANDRPLERVQAPDGLRSVDPWGQFDESVLTAESYTILFGMSFSGCLIHELQWCMCTCN